MASLQEPEVQFAQRLASNEKPVRTKAIKKLRKYIHVRSQKAADGFTPDELLKLWKGLFYCLWMQDKPLLQEQLSNQISGLIHSFQDVDGQLLFMQSFLQTFKREWTGIDRLRMDKFLQLIRFMFRQTFQMLKKSHWDSSVVSRFLQLLAAQLLQSGCEAPCGLQLHVLDVYLSELATVAADELTADQNLVFIEPFCKTAARTKDRTLFGAIRSSIFSTIIEQAPFAIEDLMRELKAAAADSDPDSDLDPGQASEEEPGQADHREQKTGGAGKKAQMNGSKSKEDEDDEDEPLEESDPAGDEDVGPVLQFDYGALAAKLFELASRSSTPNRNRQQLYSLVRVLRNLSEGIFPQHEVPEEVSTDEDDDMFCSRKRMKRRRREEEEEESPASKKSRKKKDGSLTTEQTKDPVKEKTADSETGQKKRKRKRRKKKKSGAEGGCHRPEETAEDTTEEERSERLRGAEASQQENQEEGQLGPAGLHQAPPPGPWSNRRSVRRGAAENGHAPSGEDTFAPTPAKKRRKRTTPEEEAPRVEKEDAVATVTAEKKTEEAPRVEKEDVVATVTAEQKKRRKRTTPEEEAPRVEKEDAVATVTAEKKTEEAPRVEKEDAVATVTAEQKKRRKRTTPEEEAPRVEKEDAVATVTAEKKTEEAPRVEKEDAVATVTAERKKKKKIQAPRVEKEDIIATVTAEQKKRRKKKLAAAQAEEEPAGSTSLKKKRKRKIPVVFEFEADELQTVSNGDAPETTAPLEEGSPPPSAKEAQKKKKKKPRSAFVAFQTSSAPSPLFWRTRGGAGRKTPTSESKKVTFGLSSNQTAEFRKWDRSLLLSPDGSRRVPFDPQQKPKCGVLKPAAAPRGAALRTRTAPQRARARPTAADFF